jgi:hypothetical protein
MRARISTSPANGPAPPNIAGDRGLLAGLGCQFGTIRRIFGLQLPVFPLVYANLRQQRGKAGPAAYLATNRGLFD